MERSNRVAVGVPVRNGGASLRLALEALLGQTHGELEILISDNASTDGTAATCQEFAARDGRIRYVRQPRPLSALDNFRFVFEGTDANYFLWASHDDLREPNYVASLVQGFRGHPQAVLAFPDVATFSDHEVLQSSGTCQALPRGRSLIGVRFPERHRLLVTNGPCQIYGLIRRESLEGFPWPRMAGGFDWLILHYLATLGDFVHVPSTTLYYYVPAVARLRAEYDAYHWLQSREHFGRNWLPDVAWALTATREISRLRGQLGDATNGPRLFWDFCFMHHGGPMSWARSTLYRNAPPLVRAAWSRLKTTLRFYSPRRR
jgi:glycosyltransferase involved in cell wall biosynthesis